jgi:dihydrofolate reductase
MRIRLHTSMSLDGFSAGVDGWPALAKMPDFVPGQSYGHAAFFAQCDAVLVGRSTFEPALGAPNWPWPGKRIYVLTSRPLTAPEGVDVVACDGPTTALVRLKESGLTGDVHLLGGPSAIRAMYEIGAIDRLEILVLPLLFGTGTPLFPLSTESDRLHLDEQCTYPDGAIKLCYTPVRPA